MNRTGSSVPGLFARNVVGSGAGIRTPPTPPAVIPLPAGAWLLASAVRALCWAGRWRRPDSAR